MGVDVAHLVLVALGDANDQVVLLRSAIARVFASIPAPCDDATYDESADRADGGDGLARAVVELNLDEVLLGVCEADRQVAERLGELALRIVRTCLELKYRVRLTRGPVAC
jgi:hypothetical protein